MYHSSLLSLLFVVPPFILFAQPSGTCECFETEILSITDTLTDCRYFEMEVRSDGDCRHALSNFVMEIACGSVSDGWNSLDTKMEFNFRDPNSGLSGFKVDNVNNFGGGSDPDTFRVGFTLCADDEFCLEVLADWQPVVAYKAGRCVVYDTLDISGLPPLLNPLSVDLMPNPASEQLTIKGKAARGEEMRLVLLNSMGREVVYPIELVAGGKMGNTFEQTIDVSSLPRGLYFYRIQSAERQRSGRIWLQ